MCNIQMDLWTELFLLNASSKFDFDDKNNASDVNTWYKDGSDTQEKIVPKGFNDEESFDASSGSSFIESLMSNMDGFFSTASTIMESLSPLKEYTTGYSKIENRESVYGIPHGSKFFVIKSFNERNVKLALQNSVWSSTRKGNRRIEREYHSLAPGAKLFLLFSVNKSGKFCGIAEMCSGLIENDPRANIWETHTDSYTFPHLFQIKWRYVKDVQVRRFNHLVWETDGEQKSLGHGRDTEIVPFNIGHEIVAIFHNSYTQSSLLF
ncbi:Pho92 [Kluyveromyces lactis]|nr:Pho92 [Kluyveromyces lactis]